MTLRYLLLISLTLATLYSAAQEKKFKLQSISNIGVVNSKSNSAFAIQTIIGVNAYNTFVGIGGGIDFYRYRSIPLFVDLRHEFGKDNRNFFIYGDLGHNYEWIAKDKLEITNIYELQNRFQGGLYYDVGAGYNVGFKKSDALVLSAGYSFKKLKSEAGSGICPVNGPCSNDIQTYQYYLSRIVFKAGFRF